MPAASLPVSVAGSFCTPFPSVSATSASHLVNTSACDNTAMPRLTLRAKSRLTASPKFHSSSSAVCVTPRTAAAAERHGHVVRCLRQRRRIDRLVAREPPLLPFLKRLQVCDQNGRAAIAFGHRGLLPRRIGGRTLLGGRAGSDGRRRCGFRSVH